MEKKMIQTKEENPKGLHQRYIVSKVGGEPIDEGAEYFVLRLDNGGSDPIHIECCRQALVTYAILIRNHLPELSNDIIERYGKTPN